MAYNIMQSKCPKLKNDISGFKIGFIVEKCTDFVGLVDSKEIETYRMQPVLIMLDIYKSTRITARGYIIRDRDCDPLGLYSDNTKFYRLPDDHAVTKYRCSRAHVKAIYRINQFSRVADILPDGIIAHSYYNPKFKYQVGKTIIPRYKFNDCDDPFNMCTSGIHFFSKSDEAFTYLTYWDVGGLKSDAQRHMTQEKLRKMYEADMRKAGEHVVNKG